MWWLLVLQLWAHVPSTNPHVILNGNWQSCQDESGQYEERIWDYVFQGEWHFEFHMGPYHDFALYRVKQADEHDHSDDTDELKPHFVTFQNNTVHRVWKLPDMRITVVAGGGSRNECESFYVTIERLK